MSGGIHIPPSPLEPFRYARPMNEEERKRCISVSTILRSILPKPSTHPQYKRNEYKIVFPTFLNAYSDHSFHAFFREELTKRGHRVTSIFYYGSQSQNFVDPSIIPHDRDVCHEISTSDPSKCIDDRQEIQIDFVIGLLKRKVAEECKQRKELSEKTLRILNTLVLQEEEYRSCSHNKKKKLSHLQQLILDEYFYRRCRFEHPKNNKLFVGSLLGFNDHDILAEYNNKSPNYSNISIVECIQSDFFNYTFRSINHRKPYPLIKAINAIYERKYIIDYVDQTGEKRSAEGQIKLENWMPTLVRKSLRFEVFKKDIIDALQDFMDKFPLHEGNMAGSVYQVFRQKVRYPSNDIVGRRLYYLRFFSFLQHVSEQKVRDIYCQKIAAVWLQSQKEDAINDGDEVIFRSIAELIEHTPKDTDLFLGTIVGLFMAWEGQKRPGLALMPIEQNDGLQWRFSFKEAGLVHQYILEKGRSLSSFRRIFQRCKEKIVQRMQQDNGQLKTILEAINSIDDETLKHIILRLELKKSAAEAQSVDKELFAEIFTLLVEAFDSSQPISKEHLLTFQRLLEQCEKQEGARILAQNIQWSNLISQGIKRFFSNMDSSSVCCKEVLGFCQLARNIGLVIRPEYMPPMANYLIPYLSLSEASIEDKRAFLLKNMSECLLGDDQKVAMEHFKTYGQLLGHINALSGDSHNLLAEIISGDVDKRTMTSSFISLLVQADLNAAGKFLIFLQDKGMALPEDVVDVFMAYVKRDDSSAFEHLLPLWNSVELTSPIFDKATQLIDLLLEKKWLTSKHLQLIGKKLKVALGQKVHSKSFAKLVCHYINRASFESAGVCSLQACQLFEAMHKKSMLEPFWEELVEKNQQDIHACVRKICPTEQNLSTDILLLFVEYCRERSLNCDRAIELYAFLLPFIENTEDIALTERFSRLTCTLFNSSVYPSDAMREPLAKISHKLLQSAEENIKGSSDISRHYQMLGENVLKIRYRYISNDNVHNRLWKDVIVFIAHCRPSFSSAIHYRILIDEGMKHKAWENATGIQMATSLSLTSHYSEILSAFFSSATEADIKMGRAFLSELKKCGKARWEHFLRLCHHHVLSDEVKQLGNLLNKWKMEAQEEQDHPQNIFNECRWLGSLLTHDEILKMNHQKLLDRLLFLCGQEKELSQQHEDWNKLLSDIFDALSKNPILPCLQLIMRLRESTFQKKMIFPETYLNTSANILRNFGLLTDAEDRQLILSQHIPTLIASLEMLFKQWPEGRALIVNKIVEVVDAMSASPFPWRKSLAAELSQHILCTLKLPAEMWREETDKFIDTWIAWQMEKLLQKSISITQKRNLLESWQKVGLFKMICPRDTYGLERFKKFYDTFQENADNAFKKYCERIFFDTDNFANLIAFLEQHFEMGQKMIVDEISEVAFADTVESLKGIERVLRSMPKNFMPLYFDKVVFPNLLGCLFYPVALKKIGDEASAAADSQEVDFGKAFKIVSRGQPIREDMAKLLDSFALSTCNELFEEQFTHFITSLNDHQIAVASNSLSCKKMKVIAFDFLEVIAAFAFESSEAVFVNFCKLHQVLGYHVLMEAVTQPPEMQISWVTLYHGLLARTVNNPLLQGKRLEMFTYEVIIPYFENVEWHPFVFKEIVQQFATASESRETKSNLSQDQLHKGIVEHLHKNRFPAEKIKTLQLIPRLLCFSSSNMSEEEIVKNEHDNSMAKAIRTGYKISLFNLMRREFTRKDISEEGQTRIFNILDRIIYARFGEVFFCMHNQNSSKFIQSIMDTTAKLPPVNLLSLLIRLRQHTVHFTVFPVLLKKIKDMALAENVPLGGIFSYVISQDQEMLKKSLEEYVISLGAEMKVSDETLCYEEDVVRLFLSYFFGESARIYQTVFLNIFKEEMWHMALGEAKNLFEYLNLNIFVLVKKTPKNKDLFAVDRIERILKNCESILGQAFQDDLADITKKLLSEGNLN